jgi:hypothetical protein
VPKPTKEGVFLKFSGDFFQTVKYFYKTSGTSGKTTAKAKSLRSKRL